MFYRHRGNRKRRGNGKDKGGGYDNLSFGLVVRMERKENVKI
jgi:hypothetical protein